MHEAQKTIEIGAVTAFFGYDGMQGQSLVLGSWTGSLTQITNPIDEGLKAPLVGLIDCVHVIIFGRHLAILQKQGLENEANVAFAGAGISVDMQDICASID